MTDLARQNAALREALEKAKEIGGRLAFASHPAARPDSVAKACRDWGVLEPEIYAALASVPPATEGEDTALLNMLLSFRSVVSDEGELMPGCSGIGVAVARRMFKKRTLHAERTLRAALEKENVADKLKPCPFGCSLPWPVPCTGGRRYWILCEACMARGPFAESEAEAIRRWNTRPDPPAGGQRP